jgi:type III secretion protein U
MGRRFALSGCGEVGTVSEGTEQPTDHKLSEARKKGDRPYSKDFTAALNMLAWTIAGWAGATHAVAALRRYIDGLVRRIFDPYGEHVPLPWLSAHLVVGLAIVALAALLFAAVPELIQSRGQIASKRKPFDLQRINPVAGFKKLFGVARFSELGLSIVRLGVVVAISWTSLRAAFVLPWFAHGRAWQAAVQLLSRSAMHVLALTTLVFLGLALFDLLLQHRLWIRRNRMKKDEIMREHKEQQGDPLVKGLRRDAHREMVG